MKYSMTINEVIKKINNDELMTYDCYDTCFKILQELNKDNDDNNIIFFRDDRKIYIYDEDITKERNMKIEPDFFKCLICDKFNTIHVMNKVEYYCCLYHGNINIYFCDKCIEEKMCKYYF